MQYDHLSPNEAVVLDNDTCPYCGQTLANLAATKEHVVGRRFVPRGTLAGRWNLILQACSGCNRRKADLEDDVSAISMQPSPLGCFAREDLVLREEAERKGSGSKSRLTGKHVAHSSERIEIRGSLRSGGTLSLGVISPPQQLPERVFALAQMQLSAFFYWVTFDATRKRGRLWPGGFFPMAFSHRADWGNPVQRAFMTSVVKWDPRVMAATADGFFKIALRRHPTAVCWSWALEWNENVRVIGFLGDNDTVDELVRGFPTLSQTTIPLRDGRLGIREENALEAHDDCLFSWDGSEPGTGHTA